MEKAVQMDGQAAVVMQMAPTDRDRDQATGLHCTHDFQFVCFQLMNYSFHPCCGGVRKVAISSWLLCKVEWLLLRSLKTWQDGGITDVSWRGRCLGQSFGVMRPLKEHWYFLVLQLA